MPVGGMSPWGGSQGPGVGTAEDALRHDVGIGHDLIDHRELDVGKTIPVNLLNPFSPAQAPGALSPLGMTHSISSVSFDACVSRSWALNAAARRSAASFALPIFSSSLLGNPVASVAGEDRRASWRASTAGTWVGMAAGEGMAKRNRTTCGGGRVGHYEKGCKPVVRDWC